MRPPRPALPLTAALLLAASLASGSVRTARADQPPIVTAPLALGVCRFQTLTFTVAASDPDGDAIASLTAAGLPSGATFTANATNTSGTFSWTPSFTASGSYNVTFTAQNALSTSVTSLVTVNICHRPPQVTAPASAFGDEGTLITFTVTALDPDGGTITSLTAAPLPAGAIFTANAASTSGTFSWAPSFTQAGTYNVTFTATTDFGTGSAATTITVNNVDRAPAVTAPATVTGAVNTLVTFTVSASDPDGDAITSLTATGLPSGATFTTNASHTSGTFSWTSSFAQPPLAVTFTASNVLSGSATTVITIGQFGIRAPVATAPSSASGDEGTLITFTVSATDPDGPAITSLTATGLPSGATFAANATNTSGTFSWTPSFTQSGTYSVTFTASNSLSGSATTNITVSNSIPPVVTAPATASGDEGTLITFTVTASDPDGDPLALTVLGLPTGATFTANASGTSGTFSWTPNFTQAGTYSITFRANDGTGGIANATTTITVNDVPRAPTANAGGPYSGTFGFAVTFDGSGSTDPDGDPLTYSWDFGDGSAPASGVTATHTYVANGSYTATLTVTDPGMLSDTDTASVIIRDLAVVAFTSGGNKTTSLGSGKPYTCVQIEPVGGSYLNTGVILASIRMVYPVGSTNQITADASKVSIDGDKDGNGVTEITACFRKADLRVLFTGLPAGSNTVTVEIRGDLATGGTFSATMTMVVKSNGSFLAASILPNPLNPRATLTFATSRPGAIRVQMFDPQGRLVKTIADEMTAAAGYHDFEIDGTTANGTKLASGVYFVKVWGQYDGQEVKSITILK